MFWIAIVFVIGLISMSMPSNNEPIAIAAPITNDVEEWEQYYCEAYNEYTDEFTALFNSYEVKHAKNGATMIRRGNSGSFRFVKKGN